MERRPLEDELTIDGPVAEAHDVPAEVLADTIHLVQRLVWIFGAMESDASLKRRFNPPVSLRRQHTLRCGLPKAGSYAMAVGVADTRSQRELPVDDEEGRSLDVVRRFSSAFMDEDDAMMRRLAPDPKLRRLAIQTLQDVSPRENDGWWVRLTVNNAKAEFTPEVRERARRALTPDLPTVEGGSVLGELQAIDFASRKVTVLHPASQIRIECSYDDELEEDLLDSRRDLVRVTGQLGRNANGDVVTVSDARVETLDLSEVELERLVIGGRLHRIAPALTVTPRLDEDTQQLLVFVDEAFSLRAHGETPDDLLRNVREELVFAFEEYTPLPDERMTLPARRLKQELLSRIQPEPVDAA